MKKTKTSFHVRLEFSDESGKPEGGDILTFSSIKETQKIVAEILEVAKQDKVAVNLTVGTQDPFFGFLKSFGLNRKDAENEMVDMSEVVKKKTKKKANKKAAKKAPAKKTTKKKAKTKTKAKKRTKK